MLLGMFLRPTDDEFFGIVIQIPLVKGRRVHGVEQLVQLGELELDESGHDGKGTLVSLQTDLRSHHDDRIPSSKRWILLLLPGRGGLGVFRLRRGRRWRRLVPGGSHLSDAERRHTAFWQRFLFHLRAVVMQHETET